MIDTIKIKLIDLQKHREIYDRSIANDDIVKVLPKRKSKFKGTKDKEYDVFEFGSLLDRQVHYYQKSSKAVEYLRIHNRFNPSSHYGLKVYVNPARDCIVFEFSVPKYFYGTNILMPVSEPIERDFRFTRGVTDTLDHQRDTFYERMWTYVTAFFRSEYPKCRVDLACVEVMQLDISWNQVFNTKADALRYMNLQKQIKKNYIRQQTSRFYMNYETSIFYGGSGFKCEIYHKGTEYTKNDLKKHLHANALSLKAGRGRVFDCEFYQDFADRILRYEVSLRPEKMSYLFNEKIFRKKSQSYQVLKEVYNMIRSRIEHRFKEGSTVWADGVHDIVKKYRLTFVNGEKHVCVPDYIVRMYRSKKREGREIEPYEYSEAFISFYKDFDKLSNYGRRFFMALDEEQARYSQNDIKSNLLMFETTKYHCFDKKMFQVCFDFLTDFIYEYKVENKHSIEVYCEKINTENERRARENMRHKAMGRKKRLPLLDKNRMVMLLAFLENHSEDQLRKLTDMSDRTWRKYKSDLKAIGVTKQTLNEVQPINASYDLSDYYVHLITNKSRYVITNTAMHLFSSGYSSVA